MQEPTNNSAPTRSFQQKPDNKGYSIMHNDVYIGYIVLAEKNVAEETIKALQNPEVMKQVVTESVLKKFEPKINKNSDSVLEIAKRLASQTGVELVDELAAELKANS